MTPSKSYIIWLVPRPGSTLLCKGLESTGIAGIPGEYFTLSDDKTLLARHQVKDYESLKQKLWNLGAAVQEGASGKYGPARLVSICFTTFTNKLDMKNPFPFLMLLSLLFLFPACQQQVDPNLQEELSRARIRLQEMEAEVEQLRAGPEKGQLIHIVFLKTREGLPEEEMASLTSSIRKLGEIDLVKSLEVGKIADTGDGRFVTGHNIAFRMAFDGMADYQAYMEHPTHLEIRESLKDYLGGPPQVYDYWVE